MHNNTNAPRILIVDDNDDVHEDFEKILGLGPSRDSGLRRTEEDLFGDAATTDAVERVPFRLDFAHQGEEALGMVERSIREDDPYVVAFVDVRMPPGWDGVETIERIWQICPELQAVICTAYSDYSWGDVIRRFGQADNLLILKKPFETAEVLQIAHALSRKWMLGRQARLQMDDLNRMVEERTQRLTEEVRERTRVQEALHISEARFSMAFQSSPMPMAIQSWPDCRFLTANSSFLELTDHTTEQLFERSCEDLKLWEGEAPVKVNGQPERRVSKHSCVLRRRDGATRNTVLWAEPMTLDAQPCLLLVVEDVTEQLKLETQLRQSQKLEIVGRLVANIAHEFNNVLTVIQGHATLLRGKLEGMQDPAESVERILQASHRAASFTRQMLSFSRKQPVNFTPVSLTRSLQGVHKMLGQSLGERHEVKLELADNLPPVLANEGNLEQILMNLALNARDAMPDGGLISVRTSLEILSVADLRHHADARVGRFVCFSVSDTGSGIPPELITRIFDPFFSTKEVGKGTGLGLSTVQSIVQHHQGWIEVVSEVGRGSTFKIFLPALEEEPVRAEERDASVAAVPAPTRGAGEVVLLVEDEAIVREMARTTLEAGGYRVLEAADGCEALKIWDQSEGGIDLVLTDVVMPNGVSGGALANTLQARAPGLKVICTSGYTPEFIEQDLKLKRGIDFLPKPYMPSQLLNSIRLCLGREREAGCDAVEPTACLASA